MQRNNSSKGAESLQGDSKSNPAPCPFSKSFLAEGCLLPFWKECSELSCSLPRVKYDRNEVLLIVIEKSSYCLWPVLGRWKAKFVSQKAAGTSKLAPRLTKLWVTSAPRAVLSGCLGETDIIITNLSKGLMCNLKLFHPLVQLGWEGKASRHWRAPPPAPNPPPCISSTPSHPLQTGNWAVPSSEASSEEKLFLPQLAGSY